MKLNAVSGPTTPTWGWIQTPGRVRPMAYSTARAGTVVMENAAPMMKSLFRLDMRTLTFLPAGKHRFRTFLYQRVDSDVAMLQETMGSGAEVGFYFGAIEHALKTGSPSSLQPQKKRSLMWQMHLQETKCQNLPPTPTGRVSLSVRM